MCSDVDVAVGVSSCQWTGALSPFGVVLMTVVLSVMLERAATTAVAPSTTLAMRSVGGDVHAGSVDGHVFLPSIHLHSDPLK